MTKTWTFHEAWNWLENHPIFFKKGSWAGWPGFKSALDIDVVKVDSATRAVEKDKSRNTHTEIWLECGPWVVITDEFTGKANVMASHDIDLDCGGDTFEEAIIKLAELVAKKYGTYDPNAPEYHQGSKESFFIRRNPM